MSSIEWTDVTWNPVRGCSRVSAGCKNCYAERMAARFADRGELELRRAGHRISTVEHADFATYTLEG